MKINERKLRQLQKQRHMYDIQQMIFASPVFKNLTPRDQKKLGALIYKAELAEIYIRDRNIVRINQSFDDIIGQVMDMIDEGAFGQDDDDDDRKDRNDDNF